MDAVEDALLRDQLRWAEQAYIEEVVPGTKTCWFDRSLDTDLTSQITVLDEGSVLAGQDLAADDPMREPDDVAVVFRVVVNDHTLIFKRVRPDRVPTRFHEPFVASEFRKLGLGTVQHLAIICFSKGDTWLVMRDNQLPNIRTIIASLNSGQSTFHREHMCALMYNTGATLRATLGCNLRYEDIDFKNILTNASVNQQIVLCDFERTRRRSNLDEPLLTAALRVAISRRIRRLKLSSDLVAYLLAGMLNKPLTVPAKVLSQVIRAIKPAGQRKPLAVAIDGLAGAGKSTLAAEIANSLPRSDLIETDWFVKHARAERDGPSFISAHPQWYRIDALRDLLMALRTGRHVSLNGAYDHKTGSHSLTITLDGAQSDYLVVDGMYSTTAELAGAIDLRIYIDESVNAIRKRFIQRDCLRGVRDPIQTARREVQINSYDARATLAVAARQADLVLRLGVRGSYQIVSARPWMLRFLTSTVSWRYWMTELEACPLCAEANPAGRFSMRGRFQAIYNIAPIVPGHVLIAPLRHATSLHQLSDNERAEFFSYAYEITRHVNVKTDTDQFDWALQDGAAAGQTLGHLHLHILPRREGDSDRPGSWFVSLFGQESSAPDSGERRQLTNEELEKAVAWMSE
jgi:bis(5'-adenosyl)-triphosphatase